MKVIITTEIAYPISDKISDVDYADDGGVESSYKKTTLITGISMSIHHSHRLDHCRSSEATMTINKNYDKHKDNSN